MKVLITGASGFIGKALIKELSEIPNLDITAISRNPKLTNNHFGVNWLSGDLSDSRFVNSLSQKYFDKVFHLAWQGLPDRSSDLCELNLEISKKFLLGISSRKEVELNVLGSCLEFGATTGKIFDSTQPKSNDDFGQAKIELNEFVKSIGVNYRWFRPFFVFGTGQNPRALIPSIIESIRLERPIKINSVDSSHDFIAVEDVANAISTTSMMNGVYGEINIGTGELTSVGEIARTLYSTHGLEFNQNFNPSNGFYAESKVLRSLCSWSPKYAGIEGILQYYKMKLSSDG
jgi:nucleoside-diphosphate-sugar epimerase